MDPAISPSTGGGGASSYPDSVDSSPRSRGGESWDEPSYSSPKLRLMCSYGGRIVPRPTDKSLCYLGGETRLVVVDRNSSLSDFSSKLSRSLLGGRPFSLKYQLPTEDLDSLISVTTDEDLDNMIEEYDRIAAAVNPNSVGPTKRVRLFLFPSKSDSAPSSIGSLLDDSKSDTWFVDALNGAIGMGMDDLPSGLSTDSASVNCLLGLEDDSSVHSRAGPDGGGGGGAPGGGDKLQHTDPLLPRPDSSGKLTRPDVHSVPDSPMLDTPSSFGSASSAPLLSNLPPIRVRPDDRPPDPRYANIEDHFMQMNLQSATTTALSAAVPRQEEALKGPSASPAQAIPLPTASASTPPPISPKENPRPGVSGSEEDDKPEAWKVPAAPNQKPVSAEAPIPDRPVYYQERIPMAPPAGNPISDLKREIPVSDQAYRMQTVSAVPPEQMHPQAHLLQQQQQQQQQAQQPQQFVHANPNYVQVLSYYHQVPHLMQQSQPFDQQIPMYYLPVRQNPQQPPAAAVPLSKLPPKTEMATNIYRTVAPPAPMVHMVPPTVTDQGQLYNHMGYHVMHRHHPSPATQVANYGYEYANAVATATPDQLHPQVYYTQATSPPQMPGQYQTVVQEENTKQNRGS